MKRSGWVKALLAVGLSAALVVSAASCTQTGGEATMSSPDPANSSPTSSGMSAPSTSNSANSPMPTVPGSPADPKSAAAIRWGVAPVPEPGVTLQPDVVIVGGGGTSIRNATEDGLTYYLDPHAPHASELVSGKVMFVTGRALGRVLDARPAGADLAVTIGPVDITEVIRDADIHGSAPASLANPIAYPAGDPFWAADPHPDSSTQAGPDGLRRANAAASAPPPIDPVPLPKLPKLPPLPPAPNLPAVPGRAPQIPPSVSGFGKVVGSGALTLSPSCCEGGVGTHFHYDKGGVRMDGNVSLVIGTPSVDFTLNIKGGTVTEAGLKVSGASGIKADFRAARQDTDSQINEKVAIPVDFSVSFAAFGIPLSAVVNQWVVIKTAFSAKGGAISASGEYAFNAGLGFGYSNGKFSASAPASVSVKQSITDTLDGISLGATGVVLSYQARFLVGIGAFGFTAGVYFGFTASLGVTRGSDAGVFAPGTGGTQRVVCKGVQLSLFVNYGVGYSIPKPVADLINVFLRVFHTAPIQRAGGIGGKAKVFEKYTHYPDLKVCGGSV